MRALRACPGGWFAVKARVPEHGPRARGLAAMNWDALRLRAQAGVGGEHDTGTG